MIMTLCAEHDKIYAQFYYNLVIMGLFGASNLKNFLYNKVLRLFFIKKIFLFDSSCINNDSGKKNIHCIYGTNLHK